MNVFFTHPAILIPFVSYLVMITKYNILSFNINIIGDAK